MSTVAPQRRTSAIHASIQESTAHRLEPAIEYVHDAIAPVWPLRDFVAVNPYGGFADRKFLDVREHIASLSDCEMLMSNEYYQARIAAGKFGLADLQLAIDEMVADGIPGAESLHANSIYQLLTSDELSETQSTAAERLRLISHHYDRATGSNWATTFSDEVSKFCAAHYDQGQASWASPFKELPLYQAWRAAAKLDRRIEILGIRGFRTFVSELPEDAETAIGELLLRSHVPSSQWNDYLLCTALSLPGWSAWTKYQSNEAIKRDSEHGDLTALLAIRLAYDVALSEQFDFQVDHRQPHSAESDNAAARSEALQRFALLRANEIGFRDRVLEGIRSGLKSEGQPEVVKSARQLSQMVFCIDVRSERMRRNLETSSGCIDTFGFAGFFGLPFEYVRLGDDDGTNQLPVLIEPQFKVYEDIRGDNEGKRDRAAGKRRAELRGLRYFWKSFQSSAVSSFAFVETTGLLYVEKLVRRILGYPSRDVRLDGIPATESPRLGPTFRKLHQQGISISQQITFAESILRGIGITDNFARLVVLCGHGAQTENNPLHAGLDCGACGGHSGEANARFGAMLLNAQYVRDGLAERGIAVPKETHFLAATHNTTTDAIDFHDVDLMPDASAGYFAELQEHVADAAVLTRQERLSLLPGRDDGSLLRRSVDWSEVRPEWGLTGNAAFVIGPRALTSSFSLRGESFLHSYDYRKDPEGTLLEQIMTAPLVVTNWINMQYYASTVDQKHFGSGKKTIHNVVGKFGVLSGNGGDLTTGLPWESIHNGNQYQHDPKRLLTVIEAPRAVIDRILNDHANVRHLVVNGWLNLIAIEDDQFYRFTECSEWEPLETSTSLTELQSA